MPVVFAYNMRPNFNFNCYEMDFRIQVQETPKFCFIDAVNDKGVRIGKVGIEYSDEYPRYAKHCNGKRLAKIIYVSTSISQCGKGVATELLNTAIEFLEDYNLYLTVVPMPREGESIKHRTVKGLMEFYSKFGFERCDSDVIVPTMIRKAKI